MTGRVKDVDKYACNLKVADATPSTSGSFERAKSRRSSADSLNARLRGLQQNLRHTPLGRFYRWLRKVRPLESFDSLPPNRPVDPGDPFNSTLVPTHLPLPPLEIMEARRAQSRRHRAHSSCALSAWCWTEWLITCFTFWSLGSPKAECDYAALGSWQVTGSQSHCVGRLFESIRRQLRSGNFHQGDSGRGPSKLLHILNILSTSTQDVHHTSINQLITCQALPLNVKNAGIPVSAGGADPRELLCPERSDEFQDFKSRIKNPPPPASAIPQPCYRVDGRDEPELRRAMLGSKMAVLVEESLIPKDENGRLILGGLFGVPHSDSHRVIFDRRPQNMHETRLNWARLPHGCMMIRVVLRSSQIMRGSGGDLSKYFYRLKQLEGAIPRNCFGRRFDGGEYAEFGGAKGLNYRLGLAVVGMGDLNAVDVAHMCHLDLLERYDVVNSDLVMEYGLPLPDSDVLVGVYIDDLLVLHVCDRGRGNAKQGPDRDAILRAYQAYEENGLPRSTDKDFGFGVGGGDAQADTQFKAWGTCVDTETGEVATHITKRLTTAYCIFEIMEYKSVPKLVLVRALALAVHPFMHRRPLFCCMHRVHKYVASFEKDYDEVLLLPDIKDELLSVGLLLLCAAADIRAQVSTLLTETDATPQAGGSLSTNISRKLALALYNSCQTRGAQVSLKSPGVSLPDLEESKLLPEDPMVREISVTAPWKCINEVEHGETTHVNLNEVREMLWAFQHQCKLTLEPLRCVNLADSMVTIGSWAHGRSSSMLINGLYRKNLGYVILGEKTMDNLYVRSEFNVADDPSRHVPLRTPEEPPGWLKKHYIFEAPEAPIHVEVPWRWKLAAEGYAGHAGLSCGLARNGVLVGVPLEAFRGKVRVTDSDLESDEVVARLINMILCGIIWYIHFGVPCATWGSLANLNYTRTRENPNGTGHPNEEIGNRQAHLVCVLCIYLVKAGGYYSIENPAGSTLFHFGEVIELRDVSDGFIVRFHQCMYNLQLPGTSKYDFVRKGTDY